MLKSSFAAKENENVSKFPKTIVFLKRQNVDYHPEI